MQRTFCWLAVTVCLSAAFNVLEEPRLEARADTRASQADADASLRDYYSANGLLNRGLYDLATAEYRKFLSKHENHEKAPVARYGLAVSLFRMKQYDAAAQELEPLHRRSQFEFAAEVGTILGQCHLAKQRHAQAAEAFERVVRSHIDPDLADDAAAGLGEALYLNGRYDDVVTVCRAFVNRWADSPLRERVEFFASLAEMAQHDYTAAADRFGGLLKRYPTGPFAQQASLLLAQCYHHDNAIENAIRQYREVLEQTNSPCTADALFGLGTLLEQKGEYGEAGTTLDRLLEESPDNALSESARFHRGRVWFDQEHFERALELFKVVADEDGDLEGRAAYWMGKCKLRMGDDGGAAEQLEAAIDRFPESELIAEMYYDRAIALVRDGELADAVRALKAYRSRFPEHALAPDALQLLAATEHQRHRFTQSEKFCQEFLEQYPSHELSPSVAFFLAENGFLAETYEEAAERYRRFLAKHPDDPQVDKATFRLGMALYRLQEYDDAGPALLKVTDGSDTRGRFRPALLALGDIHFQHSEWDQSEEYLRDYLSSGLDVASADDALLKLGLSRQRLGRIEDAIEVYDQLIDRFEQSPHRLQAMFERGQALVALDRSDEAVQAFEAVLADGSDSRFAPHALNHLAAIATQRDDFETASKLYARTADAASETEMAADALFQSGRTLMAAQQFKAAEAAFDRFLDKYGSHPLAPEARAQRAIALARQDRHADAVEAIEQVEQHSSSDLDPTLRAALTYEKAWCLRELDRTEDAAKAYRRLLEGKLTDDLTVHAVVELAGIEINEKRFEEAAKVLWPLQRVIEEDANAVAPQLQEQGTYRLALCEFELKHHGQAAELFERFVERFPNSSLTASASYYCGEALFKLERYERAVKHLTRASDKSSDDALGGPSLLRLGEALAKLQSWTDSEQAFTTYLDRFGESPHAFQALFGVGWAREHQKRYDEAISSYRQVVAVHQGPTAARAQFQMGECLFADKRYDEAVRALLKVDILYAYPEWSAAALYEAGQCFEKLGKPVEARMHFNQVIEKHKETRWAKLASRRLSETSATGLPGR